MEHWGPGEEMTINWWRQVRSVLGVGEVSRRRDYWPQFSKKARIFGRKKAMFEKTDLKKWSKFDNKWGYLVMVMSITQELQWLGRKTIGILQIWSHFTWKMLWKTLQCFESRTGFLK